MTDEKVKEEPDKLDALRKEHNEYLERDNIGEKMDSFLARIEDRLFDALLDLRKFRWGIMKIRKSDVEQRVCALEDTLKEYDYLSRLHNLRKEAEEAAKDEANPDE